MSELWELSRHWREHSRRHATWLGMQIRQWVLVVVRSVQAALAPETALTAAAISYFTFFSLFPLTLLTVAIASIWLDPILAESEVVTRLEFVAPALGELLGANIERIVRTRGPITGFALLILLWSSSNIFNVLTRAMDRIWQVRVQRPAWRHRGLAILMAMTISGLLLAASFVEGVVTTIANSLVPGQLRAFQPLTNQFWAAFISVILFALLYYFLPHVKLSWREVLPGAIGAALPWELAKRAFLKFVETYLSRSNLVYGSVATITAFLTWTYVSSIIFLFGAYLIVEYARLRARSEVQQKPGSALAQELPAHLEKQREGI